MCLAAISLLFGLVAARRTSDAFRAQQLGGQCRQMTRLHSEEELERRENLANQSAVQVSLRR